MAGVPLPTSLTALAALKPELRAMAPNDPAPGVPPIPPSGVKPPEDPGSRLGARLRGRLRAERSNRARQTKNAGRRPRVRI
jgi:hypothetical protein